MPCPGQGDVLHKRAMAATRKIIPSANYVSTSTQFSEPEPTSNSVDVDLRQSERSSTSTPPVVGRTRSPGAPRGEGQAVPYLHSTGRVDSVAAIATYR
jgi:hypothetical protein